MLPIKIRKMYGGFIKIAVTRLRIGLDESFSQRYRFGINSVNVIERTSECFNNKYSDYLGARYRKKYQSTDR